MRRWPDQAPSRRDAGGGRAPGIVDFKGPLTQGYDPMSSSSILRLSAGPLIVLLPALPGPVPRPGGSRLPPSAGTS